MGDFNVTVKNKFMIDLCELNDLSSLIDKPIEKYLQTKPVTSNIEEFLRLAFPIFIFDSNRIQNGISKA